MQYLNPELLKRYHEGTCSTVERETVEDWLAREDNFFTGNSIQPRTDTQLEQELWKHLQQHISVEAQVKPARIRKLRVPLVAAACVAAIIIGVGLFFLLTQSATRQEQQLASRLKSYTVPKGSRFRLLLPDSSIVYVMGESTVQFPETFGNNTRDLILRQGEIFLEVAQQPNRPFIVHSSGAKIKVLGTSFNVRNTSRDPFISVALTQGSIQFTSDNNISRVLKPGEILHYDKAIGLISSVERMPENDAVAGWTKGILYFNNEPLRNVFNRLEEYYGFRFVLKDKIDLDKPLTATLDNLPLSRVLTMMEFSTALKFIIADSTVVVKSSR